jgi:hypothetical protein
MPLITVPPMENIDQVIGFDRFLLENNLNWEGICRRCFHFELPPGMFKRLSTLGKDILVVLRRVEPGRLLKMIATGSLEEYGNSSNSCSLLIHGFVLEHYEPVVPQGECQPSTHNAHANN